MPSSPVVISCGSEDDDFFPGSIKWILYSRSKDEHSVRKQKPLWWDMVVGEKNVIAEALVDGDQMLLPTFHIKLS